MPHWLVALLTQDAQVQAWAARVLVLCALFQLFDANGITHSGALRGAGDNWIQAILSVALGFTLFLPGGYFMALRFHSWGILGPWTAATVYIMVFCVCLMARWKWGPWEKIDLFADHAPATGAGA
jgi:multidrug resistance protein, MATE family